MIKTYLKIVFKNLWKNKIYSLINIIGLAAGLAIFIVGLLYLNHEWAYDEGFKDYKEIYRIEAGNADGFQYLSIPQPISDVFKSEFPEIEALTKFSKVPLLQPLLKVNDKNIYVNNLFFVDSSFFKIFNFPFTYGNIRYALSKPNAIVLSKETSIKLFRNIDPVGKSVLIGNEGNFTPFIVAGVFDNKKLPTHLSMDAIRLIEPSNDIDLWNDNPAYTYIKLNPHVNISQLEKKLSFSYREAFLNHYSQDEAKKKSFLPLNKTISLQPLTSIYLHSHTKEEISKNGSETSIWLIGCLITFMLIVSAVNFTNLNIAEAPRKAKEIAIRKIIGSSKLNILIQLYLEILVKCFIALIIALLIVELILPAFSNVLLVPLSLFENGSLKIWLQIIALLICVILIAGTYPVLYISFFQTTTILKGNFVHSPKGNGVRNILLVIQFMITSIFIAGVFIISNQLQFLRNKYLGFNPQQVLIITPGQFQTQFKYPFIKNELKQIPGIQNISYTSAVGNPNEHTVMHLIMNGEEYTPQYVCTDTGYFDLMGAHIISGRNFSETLGDSLNSLIVNRTLADELGIKNAENLGDIKVFKKNARIIGIASDMNFYGFENKIAPMAFTTMKLTLTPFILLKLNTTNISSAIQSIQSKWKDIEPGYPLRYKFLDQSYDELYNNYERLSNIFRYFTVCALFIALIGLFALTALITIQRSREIAIRKVLGASIKDILKLLNKNFVKLIIIANALAWPIVYVLSQKWLNNFAYRIEIPFTPFIIATVISLTLTIFTVCIQTLKVTRLNPIDRLKQE